MYEGGDLSLEDIEDIRGETLEEVRLKAWRKLFTEIQGLESMVDRAGLLHFFNRRILTIIIPELNTDQWNRLIHLSFVRNLGEDKWVFHDLARELVAAELGDRISGLVDELARLLEEKSREESDYALLGLSISVEALACHQEALEKIVLQVETDLQMAESDALKFLDSIRIDSVIGQAIINRLRGNTLLNLGRVADGEHALLEALEFARSVVVNEQDINQASISESLGSLGYLYFYTGRFSESEETFKESLRISTNLQKIHPNPQWPGRPVQCTYSVILTNYGYLLSRQGRFDEAKDSLREAEQSILKYFERSDSELKYDFMVHSIQQGFGLLLFYSGEAIEAEGIYRKIIESSKRPAIQIGAWICLGETLSWTGSLSEAEKVLQQALEALQRLAVDDPSYAVIMLDPLIHLGYILRVSHRPAQAEEHYLTALGICRKIADKTPEFNRDNLAFTLREFAVFLHESGRYSEAEELSLEALELAKVLAKKSHMKFAILLPRIYNNHAVILSKLGKLSEAETTIKKALEIVRDCIQGKSKPVFYDDLESAILNNMGIILWSTNRTKEGLKALEEASALQSNLAKKAPLMFNYHLSIALNNIGVVTCQSGESSKGEEYLIESLRMRRELEAKTPGRYLLYIASSLNNLAIIKEESNRIKESEILRSEALDILNTLTSKEPQSNFRYEQIKANIESKKMSEEYRDIYNLMI